MIPVSARGSIARMSAPRQFVVCTLDDEFRLVKGIVIAHMVYVKMGTDEDIDFVRTQSEIGEMLKYIFCILGFWGSRRWCLFRRKPAIDETVLPISRLHAISSSAHSTFPPSPQSGPRC